ncbi:MAG: hypothetical protein II099_01795 [Firmicutes bacterium]|nr:hypothetical protein [Bacillota bacterium]
MKNCLKKSIITMLVTIMSMVYAFSPAYATDNISESDKNELYSSTKAFGDSMAIVAADLNSFTSTIEKSVEIVTIKDLRDFVGNRYAVAECSPTGYIIYNYKNSSIVEYSEYADSPYLNCEGDLYYCGPMEYYEKTADNCFINTITGTCVDEKTIEIYETASKELQEGLIKDSHKQSINRERNSSPKSITYTYVGGHKNFYYNLASSSQMGYYVPIGSDGICGYIAAGLVLLYHDYYFNNNYIVNSTYLASGGQAFNGIGFTQRLYYIGTVNLSYDDTLTAGQAANVMKKYLSLDRNITINYWSAVNPSLVQIRNQISYHGTPVIYENKFVNPNNTSQTVHHDVVVYGYTNDDRLVVHFGWPGRSHIVCTGTALLIWNSTASAIANYS